MKYLFWCANEHISFRIAELKALASLFKIPIKWMKNPGEEPYIVIELKNEDDARKLVSRSMLVRSCFELWGHGTTEEEMHCSVNENLNTVTSHLRKKDSFRITVTSFNKTLSKVEKLNKIESFSYLPFEGKVNLQSPDIDLHFIEYYGLSPNNIPDKPFQYFFGKWLSDGQRALMHPFSLKKRAFIGSTSMDAQLAFLMTNMAQIRSGSIVMDPFVGTGSILVSAAQRDAYVWGWDIDFLTLHGRTKPTRFNEKKRKPTESILSNLQQYHLQNKYLDVAVMDSSNPCWRKCELIDAIITDPPYGIRESTERVGSLKERKSDNISPEHKGALQNELADFQESQISLNSSTIHYPSKMAYNLADIFVDLLNFSATHLTLGGRLVFWVPVFREDYSDDVIPSHPCLELESNCEQVLNTHSSRRLITLVKTRSPENHETAVADSLAKVEEFRIKFFQASQLLTKDERQRRKQVFPTDKRGQGLGYRVHEAYEPSNSSYFPNNTSLNVVNSNNSTLEGCKTPTLNCVVKDHDLGEELVSDIKMLRIKTSTPNYICAHKKHKNLKNDEHSDVRDSNTFDSIR